MAFKGSHDRRAFSILIASRMLKQKDNQPNADEVVDYAKTLDNWVLNGSPLPPPTEQEKGKK